jgi:ATP-binding cassette subfamily G (WHITE) protein 1
MELSECILWERVSFQVEKSLFEKLVQFLNANRAGMKTQVILSNTSAKIDLNRLNAILGPSGCGKSTLLKALLGKHGRLPVGYSGKVRLLARSTGWMNGQTSKDESIENESLQSAATEEPELLVSYVPQKDELHENLTVLESIEFAFDCKYVQPTLRVRMEQNPLLQQSESFVQSRPTTKLKKSQLKKFLVETVMQKLSLVNVKSNPLSRCSGGERKRVSIAAELLCLPNLLLLDEPTTGLDSASSMQLITFLNECVDSQSDLTVLAIVHQPSFDLFAKFQHVTILGQNGTPVYSGQPEQLLDKLQHHGLMCPNFCNPADFVLDVANGDFGATVVNQLQETELNKLNPYLTDAKTKERWFDLTRLPKQIDSFCWTHFWLLIGQTQLLSLRDRDLLIVKFFSVFGFLFFNYIVYGTQIASFGGCPAIELIQHFDPGHLEQIFASNKREAENVRDATGMMFIHTVIPLYIAAVLPAFVFPQELRIFLLHRRNLLYSTVSYVSAKTIADIPLMALLTLIYSGSSYLIHGAPLETWRLSFYIISFVLGACCIQGMGYVTGAMFLNNASASVYITPLVSIPLFMFVDRVKFLPYVFSLFEYVKHFSYARVTFRSALIALYGNQRCGANLQQVFTNFTQNLRWYLEDSFGVQVERLEEPRLLAGHWSPEQEQLFNCSSDSLQAETCALPNGLFDTQLLLFLVQLANNLSSEIAKQAGSLSTNLTLLTGNTTEDSLFESNNTNLTRTIRQVFGSEVELIGNQTWSDTPVMARAETGISIKFIDTLMKLINGQFIDKRDGLVKSYAIIDFKLEDSGIWINLFSILWLIVAFRVVSLLLVFRHTKNN